MSNAPTRSGSPTLAPGQGLAPGQKAAPGQELAPGQKATPGQELAPGQKATPGQELAPGHTSLAEEAWGLLRDLLFAERRRFFSAASEFDLYPAQAGALLHLDDESGLPMHEIASHLACDSSNVTGIVDRLEARGLVTRRTSERDRRVKEIVPTSLGLEVRDAIRERTSQTLAGIERLSAPDQRLLRDLLARAFSGDGPSGPE